MTESVSAPLSFSGRMSIIQLWLLKGKIQFISHGSHISSTKKEHVTSGYSVGPAHISNISFLGESCDEHCCSGALP